MSKKKLHTALALALMFSTCCQSSYRVSYPLLASRSNAPRMVLELTPARTIIGEHATVAVTIENPTASKLFLPDPTSTGSPQPLYRVDRPGSRGPVTFTMRLHVADHAAQTYPIDILEVPAGEFRSGGFTLNDFVGLDRMGKYQVDARVEWDGLTLVAPTTTLQVTTINAFELHAGHGTWQYSPDSTWAPGAYITFFHKSAGRTILYGLRMEDADMSYWDIDFGNYPSSAEYEPERQLQVSNHATDLMVAWPNHHIFHLEGNPWVIWREDQDVCARAVGASVATRVALPFSPSRLISPGLKAHRQNAEVLALSADRSRIAVVQFGNDEEDAPHPSGIRFTAVLPVRPLLAIATLAPASARSVRHVGFASNSATGIEISTTHYTARRSKFGKFRSVSVADVTLVPDTSMTMAAFADGSTRLATAVRDVRGKLSILEVTFPKRRPPRVALRFLTGPDIANPKVHLLYVHDEISVDRLDAIVHASEDELFQILTPVDRPWTLSPVSFHARDGAPVALVAGREAPYVVSVSEWGDLDTWTLK